MFFVLQAEKLQTKTLPYPFKDKEHFERSNRMPLGPEFNPATTIGALNRPEVCCLFQLFEFRTLDMNGKKNIFLTWGVCLCVYRW